jgi:hypothetical protein
LTVILKIGKKLFRIFWVDRTIPFPLLADKITSLELAQFNLSKIDFIN